MSSNVHMLHALCRFWDTVFIFNVNLKKQFKKSIYLLNEVWLRICDASKTIWTRPKL